MLGSELYNMMWNDTNVKSWHQQLKARQSDKYIDTNSVLDIYEAESSLLLLFG